MLSRTWAPSPIEAPAPRIDEDISALSSTLTPSKRAAFVNEARPILHDFPRTTCGPRRPSTYDPAPTYTGGRSEPAVTSASGAIFPRPASRRTRCAFRYLGSVPASDHYPSYRNGLRP